MPKSQIYGGSPHPYSHLLPKGEAKQRPETKRHSWRPSTKSLDVAVSYVIHEILFKDITTVALLDARTFLPSSFPQMHTRSLKSSDYPSLEVRNAGKKGEGVFTTSKICAGQTVAVEHPALIFPDYLETENTSDIYCQMFFRALPDVREKLMHLSNSYPGKDEADTLAGIIATNSFPLEVGSGAKSRRCSHGGVFLTASRCNHSCGPNTVYVWDPVSFKLTLTAVRDISSDEEITIHYVSPNFPRATRREMLSKKYSFDCLCEYCEGSHSGDTARALVWTADKWNSEPSFEDWVCSQDTGHHILDIHLKQIALMDREGLQCLPSYGRHIDMVAMCYGALASVDKFRYWVGRVREIRGGERAPKQDIVFAHWLSNPESCGVWNTRQSVRAVL